MLNMLFSLKEILHGSGLQNVLSIYSTQRNRPIQNGTVILQEVELLNDNRDFKIHSHDECDIDFSSFVLHPLTD